MLNSHCNNNDNNNQKKHKKTLKKSMQSTRFKPGIYGFKDHHGIHYAMEANRINQ